MERGLRVWCEAHQRADDCADDLASISLGPFVAETGERRHGLNLMLLFGDCGPADDGGS